MRTSPDTAGHANSATLNSGVPPHDDHPRHSGPSSGDGHAHGPPSSVTDHSNYQQVQHASELGDDFELERPQGGSELDGLEIDDVRPQTVRALPIRQYLF